MQTCAWTRRQESFYRLLITVLAMALVLAMTVPTEASASEPDSRDFEISAQDEQDLVPVGGAVTAAEYEVLFRDLTRSDMKRETNVVDGVRHVTFAVPIEDEIISEYGLPDDIDEFELTLTAPNPAVEAGEDEFTTQGIGGGYDGRGIYISFGPTSQRIIAMGAGAGLTAAICGQPVVGWVACAAASSIIAMAFGYLAMNGICTQNRDLRVYFSGWMGSDCV